MFFAKPGVYEPCGMFNYKHLILFVSTIILIAFFNKYTKIKEKKDVRNLIKKITCIIWFLEITKIVFNFAVGDGFKINKVVPLYYCSLLLYAGLFSSFGKGKLQRVGDVFLATGAIVAGLVFLILPTTSLPEYPMLHFISLHSFFFHGVMIYLGVIINKTNYIDIKHSDIKYYASLIFVICVCAYVVNYFTGSNLMFVSQDFPGTPITYVYKVSGKFFPLVMSVVQMTLPFYFVYWVKLLKGKNLKVTI